jgi:hypothetical protein
MGILQESLSLQDGAAALVMRTSYSYVSRHLGVALIVVYMMARAQQAPDCLARQPPSQGTLHTPPAPAQVKPLPPPNPDSLHVTPSAPTTPSRMDTFIFMELRKGSSIFVPCQEGSTPKG